MLMAVNTLLLMAILILSSFFVIQFGPFTEQGSSVDESMDDNYPHSQTCTTASTTDKLIQSTHKTVTVCTGTSASHHQPLAPLDNILLKPQTTDIHDKLPTFTLKSPTSTKSCTTTTDSF